MNAPYASGATTALLLPALSGALVVVAVRVPDCLNCQKPCQTAQTHPLPHHGELLDAPRVPDPRFYVVALGAANAARLTPSCHNAPPMPAEMPGLLPLHDFPSLHVVTRCRLRRPFPPHARRQGFARAAVPRPRGTMTHLRGTPGNPTISHEKEDPRGDAAEASRDDPRIARRPRFCKAL